MRNCTEPHDASMVFYFYGGEGAVVIFPEASITEAEELTQRLCSQISEYPIVIDGDRKLSITASIGISFSRTWIAWSEIVERC